VAQENSDERQNHGSVEDLHLVSTYFIGFGKSKNHTSLTMATIAWFHFIQKKDGKTASQQ
jgi:hypothetical protein